MTPFKSPLNNQAVKQFQGFAVYVLGNDDVELAVAPELGAKIISLKNQRTHREWLWHPNDALKLFKNNVGDDFSLSPLVGIDECLPTISRCTWQGRSLPDHGEVWSRAWELDIADWEQGILTTHIRLDASPLVFKRTIRLHGNEVQFDYQLSNLSDGKEDFIWAIHPLFRLVAGDELDLPVSTRKKLDGEAWVDAVSSAIPEQKCAKAFARPVQEGRAAIKNVAQGDRLEFAWNPTENNTLGLWLTRGGWHGHHHFAMEPTNADNDSLAVAASQGRSGTVGPRSSLNWRLLLRVGLGH